MHERLAQQISEYEERWGIPSSQTNHADRFRILIHKLHAATGQRVVILVDEYDKPILDRIEDRAQALAIREVLKDFYSVIKDNDAHVRFAFLTGVSKFSKAGIFSGLNNLNDITVDPVYSAICGYTEADLDAVFARTARPGPGGNPELVQRLQLARRSCLQPLRRALALFQTPVRSLLVRKQALRPSWSGCSWSGKALFQPWAV